MSVSSFPCAEHIVLLRQKIEERLRERDLPLEVAERGLNQLKCQYRFGVRRVPTYAKALEGAASNPNASEGPPAFSPDQERPSAGDWAELAIHFQMAQRLEEGRGGADLDDLLDRFLGRFGNSGPAGPAE